MEQKQANEVFSTDDYVKRMNKRGRLFYRLKIVKRKSFKEYGKLKVMEQQSPIETRAVFGLNWYNPLSWLFLAFIYGVELFTWYFWDCHKEIAKLLMHIWRFLDRQEEAIKIYE